MMTLRNAILFLKILFNKHVFPLEQNSLFSPLQRSKRILKEKINYESQQNLK